MNLSEEQLSEVEQMGELFYSIDDIADNIGVDAEELAAVMELRAGKVWEAYRRGWLKGDLALRRSIAKAAENGSNPAQQMMLNLQKQAK